MRDNLDVRYLNRDFQSIQDQLINFAEAYYPNTVQDFSEGSVGLMYIDMASYVGDVLSFYTDVQFKESFIQFAEEKKNVVSLAKELGYTPKVTTPATTEIKVFAVVPAKDFVGSVKPDFRFVPIIEENMIVKSNSNPDVSFRTVEEVNFEVDTLDSPLNVDILEKDETGKPSKFLLTKTVQAVAGTIENTTFDFGKPEPYPTRTINDENVIEVLSVVDSQGNEWKQVPYLAQNRVFDEYRNTESLDAKFSEFRKEVPFLLKSRKQPKRFVVRTQTNDKTYLQFGSGVSSKSEKSLVPNPLNISDPTNPSELKRSIDPKNFLSSNSYGEIPFDTTIEVKYVSGGGVNSNVPIDDLTEIVKLNFNLQNVDVGGNNENQETLQNIKNSVRVTNPVPGTGGGPGENTEEIRRNAQAFFAAQNRTVTEEDYVARTLSMPSKFGSVAKAMVKSKSSSINLYVLGWNGEKQLVSVNEAVKSNIKTFLEDYRMLTDSIKIINGDVVNLGVKVNITVSRTSSERKAKISVIDRLGKILSPEQRGFNEPIIKGQITSELNSLDLVQNVKEISFETKINTEEGYAGNDYDIDYATRKRIIYPSKDPSVFTVRYPNKDIEVKNV